MSVFSREFPEKPKAKKKKKEGVRIYSTPKHGTFLYGKNLEEKLGKPSDYKW